MWSQEPMTEQDNLRRLRRSLAQLARLRIKAEGRHVFHSIEIDLASHRLSCSFAVTAKLIVSVCSWVKLKNKLTNENFWNRRRTN
jgi:hypothetical protein